MRNAIISIYKRKRFIMAVQRTYPVRMYPDDFEKLKSQKEETGLPWASFIKVLIKEHEQLNKGE